MIKIAKIGTKVWRIYADVKKGSRRIDWKVERVVITGHQHDNGYIPLRTEDGYLSYSMPDHLFRTKKQANRYAANLLEDEIHELNKEINSLRKRINDLRSI